MPGGVQGSDPFALLIPLPPFGSRPKKSPDPYEERLISLMPGLFNYVACSRGDERLVEQGGTLEAGLELNPRRAKIACT